MRICVRGEDPGRVGGRGAVIIIYCIKNIFSIKIKHKITGCGVVPFIFKYQKVENHIHKLHTNVPSN